MHPPVASSVSLATATEVVPLLDAKLTPCPNSYLISDSIVYLVIADKSYPRKLAFSYLSELCTEFSRSYPPETALKPGLRPYAFVKFDTFIQRTKRLYLDPRGAEASGLADGNKSGPAAANGLERLNEDLQDVTRIMTKNMEDLLWRGDSLDRMSHMSSSLRDESLKYRKAARKIVSFFLCPTLLFYLPVGKGRKKTHVISANRPSLFPLQNIDAMIRKYAPMVGIGMFVFVFIYYRFLW